MSLLLSLSAHAQQLSLTGVGWYRGPGYRSTAAQRLLYRTPDLAALAISGLAAGYCYAESCTAIPLRYDELTDSVFYHAGMQQPSLQADAPPDEAPTPIACPICLDHAVIQMDGVRLSVTINGVVSPIHAVSAYQCGNWHVFTIVLPVVSETSDRIPNEVTPL
jgi:hypothetical protein